MKWKIPFPHLLWEEIILTDPPQNRQTIFRFASVTAAIGFSLAGYWAGRRLSGIWAGVLFAIPLGLIGLVMGYFLRRWTEDILRLLVRKGIIAEPDFQNYRPKNRWD
jgi:hypothetical protein